MNIWRDLEQAQKEDTEAERVKEKGQIVNYNCKSLMAEENYGDLNKISEMMVNFEVLKHCNRLLSQTRQRSLIAS